MPVTSNINAGEITDIISSTMANIQVNASTYVSNTNTNVQVINNSTDCSNKISTSFQQQFTSSGNVFTSQSTVQSLYAQIVNSLQTENDLQTTGGTLLTDDDAETLATIQNILQTTLTQQVIVDYTNNFINTNTNIQVCNNSSSSKNVIYGTQSYIYNIYYEQYSQMEQVQQVSADIANTLQASQSVKSTGAIAILLRAIMLIAIVIIVGLLVFGVVVVYLFIG